MVALSSATRPGPCISSSRSHEVLTPQIKGVSVLQGHTHRFGAHARTTVDGRVLLGIENFSMCRREASYVANPNWQLGFSVIYVEPSSGRFQWFPVEIQRHCFVWKGREYKL